MKPKIDKKIIFIIPAFNEEKTIESVVSSIINEGFEVVVVDDSSSDNTAQLARNCGAIVIRHPINLGQGAALQTAIDYCLNINFDVLVTFDADGQHQIKDAKNLIKRVIDNEADIVLGSRFLGISPIGMPPIRKFFLKTAALYTRFTTGVPLTDTHNGLRALSKLAASKIQINQNRMAHATELVMQIKSLRIVEIPVEIIYTDYSLNKGQKLINIFNVLMDLFIGKLIK